MIEADRETGDLSLLGVKTEQEERARTDDSQRRNNDCSCELYQDIRDADAQDLAEEDMSQVATEGIGAGYDYYTKGQHPDEEEPDGGVC